MTTSRAQRSPRFTALLAWPLAGALALAACGKKEAVKLPPPEVYVTKAVAKDVPVGMELVGQTAGSKDVEIRARVEGYLESVNFRDGDFVQQGSLLYTIDPKPFESAVAQAKAQVASWKARVDQTQVEEARLKPLAEQQAVSRRDYDNAVASRDAAIAQHDAAKAMLEKSQLDLGYTRITSPVSGLADFTRVKPGSLVGRGESTLLTTVSVVDPIYFTASITEADYLKFAQRVAAATGPGGGAKREAELILADGTVYAHKGRLDAVQRAVDPKTGTLAVRLLFANPERVVRPGQYGRIRFIADVLVGAVCVPQKAVSELQGVHQVVVIGSDNKAEIRTVTMGPRSGDLWAVSEGLKAGETVVVEGLQSARPGAEVVPKPVEELAKAAAAPAASSSAAPAGK